VSDNEIRSILIERKRKENKMKRRREIITTITEMSAWAGLLFLCFMISVIGG
jgi:hypothetical protein